MVVMEAMACGCPVVALNKAGLVGGGVRDGYNGRLVDSQDPVRLAEAVTDILKNESRWKRMSENARKTAEKNDVTKSVEKMEKLYKELLASF